MDVINQAIQVSVKKLILDKSSGNSTDCYFPTYISLNKSLPAEEIGSCPQIDRVTVPAMIARSVLRAISERNVAEVIHPIHNHISSLIDISNHIATKLIEYMSRKSDENFVWNYVPAGGHTSLPNDIDDTSIAVEALAIYHYHIDRDDEVLEKMRHSYSKILYGQLVDDLEAKYYTWITKHPNWKNIDPIVNANISSACMRLNLLNFIPKEYLQSCLKKDQVASEFYCTEKMFKYSISPYLEAFSDQSHDSQGKIEVDEPYLLSNILMSIYKARSARIIDIGSIRRIGERILALSTLHPNSTLEALYTEQIKGEIISYAISPDVYYALYIELISLCDYQQINITHHDKSNQPPYETHESDEPYQFVEQNYSEYSEIVREGAFAHDDEDGNESYRGNTDGSPKSLNN